MVANKLLDDPEELQKYSNVQDNLQRAMDEIAIRKLKEKNIEIDSIGNMY